MRQWIGDVHARAIAIGENDFDIRAQGKGEWRTLIVTWRKQGDYPAD